MTPKEQLRLEIDQAPDLLVRLFLGLLRLFKGFSRQIEPVAQSEHRSRKDEATVGLLETQPKVLEADPEVQPLEAEPIADEDELPHFLKVLEKLHAEIPDSEWEKIPPDLSKNFDHDLYGGPKDEVGIPDFFKVVDEIHAEVPWSEWEKLPEDMAQNVDHYLYGAPKIQE